MQLKNSIVLLLFLALVFFVSGALFGFKYHRQLSKTYRNIYNSIAFKVVSLFDLKYRGIEKYYPKKLKIKDHQTYLNSLKDEFKAKAHIPKMATIPAGKFLMGCQVEKCPKSELPVHEVNIKSFEMAVTEVTFKQWDICVAMGGCDFLPGGLGWGRGQIPLVNVSWEQMNRQFIPWLNANSEGGYHLPSEAQWEYVARDGKIGKHRPWGDMPVSCEKSSPFGVSFGAIPWSLDKEPDCKIIKPSPVGSYAPTDWGLYDILGNVSEFTQDCANHDKSAMRTGLKKHLAAGIQEKEVYLGAPVDGSAWQDTFCDIRIQRGASWASPRGNLRVSLRRQYPKNHAYNRVGFRLARDINH